MTSCIIQIRLIRAYKRIQVRTQQINRQPTNVNASYCAVVALDYNCNTSGDRIKQGKGTAYYIMPLVDWFSGFKPFWAAAPMGTKSCTWGDFPSICLSVCTSPQRPIGYEAWPQGQPARPQSQQARAKSQPSRAPSLPARPPSQQGLRASQPGLLKMD